MNKRTLGVLMQLIGLILLLFSSQALGAYGPVVGLALIIAGAIVFRKAKKAETATNEEKPQKTTAEKVVTGAIVIVCAIIIGLILMIVVPNFIKGYQEAKQQRTTQK